MTTGAVALALAAAPALAEVVRGTPEADRLSGGAKSDTVSGRAGDDRLNGKGARTSSRAGPATTG